LPMLLVDDSAVDAIDTGGNRIGSIDRVAVAALLGRG
jgi:hypothetical protein